MKYGKSIKKLRTLLGMNQADLAEKLHIHPGTISYWELGKQFPARKMAHKIFELAKKNGINIEIKDIRPLA